MRATAASRVAFRSFADHRHRDLEGIEIGLGCLCNCPRNDLEAQLELLRCGVTPLIPIKGSVGSSGDLAPLAHLALVLIGKGRALVNGRIVKKNIHVALPHVHHSKCRDEIIRRVKDNEAVKAAAKTGGAKSDLKRKNTQPKEAHLYTPVDMTTMRSQPYIDLV